MNRLMTAEEFRNDPATQEAVKAGDAILAGMTVKRGRGRPRKELSISLHSAVTDVVSRETLQHWAMRLELASKLSAGCMDSESRHIEVAAQKEQIMLTIAAEMRAL